MNCPKCKKEMIGVEYAYGSPQRYDGISEWECSVDGTRVGRWTKKVLAEGQIEPRFGVWKP